MRYKNIETGAIIDSPSKIISKKWVLEEKEEVENNFEGITKKEITQELDSLGVEYNSKAKKQELYELMMQGR